AYQLGKLKKDSCNSLLITFYKASDITNLSHLKENPRDLYRYSLDNDMIYEYWWSGHVFLGRTKFKNGEIIDPKNTVIVTDPPPLKQ
ncbi:hypothetical protein, partial [Pedobacter nototheniae]|uniref:hypothetical protein n=1 Tax=Pedobacter nototheniae TaxID=2488994 RepID=UPI0013F3E7A3